MTPQQHQTRESSADTSHTTGLPLALSANTVAERLDVSPCHIYRLIREGEIPALRGLGKAVRIATWRLTSFLATGDWDHPDYRPHAAAPPAA